MKNIYTRRKICTLIILYAIVAVFISCSSRDDNPSNTVPPQAGTTILTFNIAGIVEENSITSIAKASVNNGSGNNSSMLSIAKNEIVSAGNFDVLTGAEGQRVTQNSDAVAATSSYYSGKINPVASTPMQTGVKYRLLVYDAVNNMLVKDVDGTVGTLPSIQVDAGRQYKWYAISTNSAITPTVNTTTGIVSGSLLANKDVLYNAGVVDAEYGQNNLNIIFKHYTSRIDVNLDTRGMFGTINNTTSIEVGTGTGSTFTNIIKTGDLNLFTAQYSNLQDVPAITAGNMVNTQGTGGALGASKTAIFYTVNQVQVASNNLRLRFGKLDLTMDDNTTRSFTNSIVPYSNTPFTPVLEGRYSINARLIESGVRVKGLLWARTNLTYDSGQADMYRLGVSNDQTSINANTNYWNWMSAIPTGPSSANVDPCTKIYPENTWRMPTSTEFTNLGNPDHKNELYGLIAGAIFSAEWNLDAGNTANPSYPTHSQDLFMPLYGYRSTSGNINDSPFGLILGVLGSGSAYYWSSTATNATNANYYYINYSRLLILVGWSNSEIKSGAKTEGRSVRCVRAALVPNT
ncbi:hypothetical protein [Elizabethkingia anophelis]|uniref:hypothetical protein n=1 Tax=Elizabethkingia anophelis TaxID=1117645 RepID=UPI00389242CD